MSKCRCGKYASFGYHDGKRLTCSKHKKEDMICVKTHIYESKQKDDDYKDDDYKDDELKDHKINGINKCLLLSCLFRASFGYVNSKAQYCGYHKKRGMVRLKDNKIKAPTIERQSIPLDAIVLPIYTALVVEIEDKEIPLDEIMYEYIF